MGVPPGKRSVENRQRTFTVVLRCAVDKKERDMSHHAHILLFLLLFVQL